MPDTEVPEDAPEASDLHSLYYSSHLPTNRRLAQELRQARELIETNRFSEALPLLDRILAADEDSFEIGTRNASEVRQGLKHRVQELLASLPPAGVAALELDQGVVARRALTNALTAGQIDQLPLIASRYPLTEAAVEAKLMIAQIKVDEGLPDTAAGIYRQLLKWPAASKQYAALIAARLAWCHAASGNSQGFRSASERLESMTSPTDRAALTRLLSDVDLDAWLKELSEYNTKQKQLPATTSDWLVEGSNRQRNPLLTVDAVPHLWPTWEARTVKETNVASRLESRVDWQHRNGVAWGLVSSPVAVGNYVIVRTPNNLVAIDWQSGRRVWETRPDDVDNDKNTLQLPHQANNTQSVVSLDATDQRLWLDAVYGAISSDGRRVYAVRNLESVNMRSHNRYRIQGLFRAGRELESPGNTLTAFDLRSEGKRVWEINGENNRSLNGCFFLGPPIAEGDSLFVLAEFADSIHLIQLDGPTGDVVWKQPLANLERSVLFDIGRRLAGATPTLSNGLVICPTGAGSVVAVDPIERSLKWVYRFEVDETLASRSNLNIRQSFGVYQPKLTSWQRNRVIASEDSILVTAPECEKLFCLDASNGKKRWAIDRDGQNQLVGVVGNRVITASGRSLNQWELDTGKAAGGRGTIELPDGFTVAGSCLLSDGKAVVPLSSHQVGIVDLANCKVSSMVILRECKSVGNLAFHRGSILSQSATSLARFDRIDSLRDQLAKAEQSEQLDFESLRIGGELAWADGNLDMAIELLEQAYRLAPESLLVRHRLTTAIVAAMHEDYTRFGSYTNLLSELSTDTRQKLELFRFSTDGALDAGDANAAFGFLREIYLIDLDAMVDLGDGHQTQSDRWFVERLNQVWQVADAALRQDIRDEVERLSKQSAGDTSMNWSKIVRYYGAIPAGREIRLRLAEEWSAEGRHAEAEQVMLAPVIEERIAQKQLSQVEQIAAMPHSMSPDYDPHGWLSQLHQDYLTWPDGEVSADVKIGQVRQTTSPQRAIYNSSRSRTSRTLQTAIHASSCGVEIAGPNLLAIAHGGIPQLISWNHLGEVMHGIPLQLSQLQNYNSQEQLKSIRFGHFLVLGIGNQVAVVDLRPNPSEQGMLLWSSQPDSRMRMQTQRTIPFQNPAFGGRITIGSASNVARFDDQGPEGELCHASPLGVVLRKDDQISCYDAIDGSLLWIRQDVPKSGICFGDSHYLLMQFEGEPEGPVISMIDGSTLGSWRSPEGKRQFICGRNLVVSVYKSGKRRLRVIDGLTGDLLLERDYESSTKLAEFGALSIATLEPQSGQFEVLDALQGEVLFSKTLEPERKLESIHPLICGDLLVLATNSRSAAQHNTLGNVAMDNAPVISGRIYALDPQTGESMWSQPATVKGQGLWMLQPAGSPALVMVSRLEDRKSNAQPMTRLLCLDKRTGRSLIRNERLNTVQNQTWSVRVDRSSNPRVTIDLRQSEVTLEFTNLPRPPEPVALSEVEGVEKSISAGLLGILKRSLIGSPAPSVDEDD